MYCHRHHNHLLFSDGPGLKFFSKKANLSDDCILHLQVHSGPDATTKTLPEINILKHVLVGNGIGKTLLTYVSYFYGPLPNIAQHWKIKFAVLVPLQASFHGSQTELTPPFTVTRPYTDSQRELIGTGSDFFG